MPAQGRNVYRRAGPFCRRKGAGDEEDLRQDHIEVGPEDAAVVAAAAEAALAMSRSALSYLWLERPPGDPTPCTTTKPSSRRSNSRDALLGAGNDGRRFSHL